MVDTEADRDTYITFVKLTLFIIPGCFYGSESLSGTSSLAQTLLPPTSIVLLASTSHFYVTGPTAYYIHVVLYNRLLNKLIARVWPHVTAPLLYRCLCVCVDLNYHPRSLASA